MTPDRSAAQAEAVTVELPAQAGGAGGPGAQQQPRRMRFVREITGALAAGMIVLAIAVLGAQVYALVRGTPGPGLLAVAGHLGAAALCLTCQRMTDRGSGRAALLPGLLLVVVALATLWLFWWS